MTQEIVEMTPEESAAVLAERKRIYEATTGLAKAGLRFLWLDANGTWIVPKYRYAGRFRLNDAVGPFLETNPPTP